jgi:hypothetical protein
MYWIEDDEGPANGNVNAESRAMMRRLLCSPGGTEAAPKTNTITLVTNPCNANAEGCILKSPAWPMAVVRCSI